MWCAGRNTALVPHCTKIKVFSIKNFFSKNFHHIFWAAPHFCIVINRTGGAFIYFIEYQSISYWHQYRISLLLSVVAVAAVVVYY